MMQALRRIRVVILLCMLAVVSSAAPATKSTTSRAAGNTTVQNNQPTVDSVEPGTASRGESVSVSGKFPDFDKIVVQLKRIGWAVQGTGGNGAKESSGGTAQLIVPDIISVKDPKTSFSFVVPFLNVPLGQYQVLVSFTQKDKTVGPLTAPVAPDGTLHVISKEPVKLTSVSPAVSYPDKEHFEFKVLGDGFSPVLEDNALLIEGRGVVSVCSGQQQVDDCVNEEVLDNGHELRFWNVPLSKYQGQIKVGVRVGDKYGDKFVPVTLARVGRKWPAVIAIISVLVLASLIVWILKRREKALTEGKMKGKLLSAIFLDPETNTYSLSKFQFYAWTAAAILGYIYLMVSKSWVQGDFTFPDIPRNLPGIIFVSAATSAVAVGITSAKGSKGAGEVNPSLADFVSTGGVVAAERLQFVVWTLIGVAAFVALTLSTEPGHINDLPSVPDNFLYLMGISSFGYLGGKLARKPGPVISKIEAETGTGTLTLTTHGSNLSPDATFKIDDAPVPANFLSDADHPNGKPTVLASEDNQPDFATVLKLVLVTTDPSAQKWLTDKHNFTLINPDGQKAVSDFTPSPKQTPPPTEQPTTPTPPPPPQPPPTQPNPTQLGPAAPSDGGTTPTTPSSGPSISDVSPNSGPAKGGTPVTISGAGFGASAAISFGGTPAIKVTVLSPTALIAQSPPHDVGAVDLVVQNSDGGTVTSAGAYTFQADADATTNQGG